MGSQRVGHDWVIELTDWQICRWYHFNGRKWRGTKFLLMRVKDESEKASLKLSIWKTKIMASGPITSWQIVGQKLETETEFIFLFSKITVDVDCSHEIKQHLQVGRKVMINLETLKSRGTTLLTKVHMIKAIELTPKKDMLFYYRGLECRSWKSRDTWSNRQICPWSTKWSRAKANQVLPRDLNDYSKHPLPTMQKKTQHMDIIRWSIAKSD